MARVVESENQGSTYMKITAGRVREASKEGAEGAKSRIITDKKTNESKTKWELVYKRVSGVITDIKTVKSDKIKLTSLVITIKDADDEDVIILQCDEKSDYAISMLEILPNVDLSKDVEFVPYQFEADGRTRTGVTLYQEITPGLGFTKENSRKIPKLWTKETPGDMPVFDPDNVEMWVLQKRQFLYKYLTDNICPKITGSEPGSSKTPSEPQGSSSADDTDDLPF